MVLVESTSFFHSKISSCYIRSTWIDQPCCLMKGSEHKHLIVLVFLKIFGSISVAVRQKLWTSFSRDAANKRMQWLHRKLRIIVCLSKTDNCLLNWIQLNQIDVLSDLSHEMKRNEKRKYNIDCFCYVYFKRHINVQQLYHFNTSNVQIKRNEWQFKMAYKYTQKYA